MDIQKFIEQLPSLYDNWGLPDLHPKSPKFEQLLEQVTGMTTENIMQLLNLAVDCLESGEIYCEIGCLQGASLIGAMLEHSEAMAYVVDNFSEFDAEGNNIEIWGENLVNFNLEEQVYFCQQDFEEFFSDLVEVGIEDKIGVYHYDGARDYRAVLLGLLKVLPFLPDRALIVVSNSNYPQVRQAVIDFSSSQSQVRELLEVSQSWILAWDINQVSSLRVAQENARNLLLCFQEEQKKEEQKYVECLDKQVRELLVQHKYAAAARKCKEIILYDGAHKSKGWVNLGKIYYSTKRYPEAINALIKAREIEPKNAGINYNLGLLWEKTDQIELAMDAYQEAINLNPKFVNPYNNLANLFWQSGKIEEAESVYHQAIVETPHDLLVFQNLANIFKAQEKWEEAIQIYLKALEVHKNNLELLAGLGAAYAAQGNQYLSAKYWGRYYFLERNYQAAVRYLENALEVKGAPDDYFYLGVSLRRLNQEEESIKIFEQGIARYPQNTFLQNLKIEALQSFGANERMLAASGSACAANPEDLFLYIKHKLILPIFYETVAEIESHRLRFIQGLKDVREKINLSHLEAAQKALMATKKINIYNISYQGYNDRELQQQYGDLLHQIMLANYPQWALPMPLEKNNDKIRIGYISESMGGGSGSRWLLGWLKHCNQEKFEIYCYETSSLTSSLGIKDEERERIKEYSKNYYFIPDNLEAVCQQVLQDNLHILVYLAIGMYGETSQLAALRLAPIQCSTWGNPVTSRLPTIDYFLSGELLESDNAQEHYTEQLIRLPNIGLSYPKPLIPEATKKRADFQLRDDAVVYFSCQLISKYLPQHDYLFAEIARQVPQAQLIFVLRSDILNHLSLSIEKKFRQRLHQAFAAVGLNSEDYCIFLPGQDWESYTSLLRVSDVFLDTLSFSGGHTTFEAVASNLPIVTCPGELMRGRQSSGILQMLGVTDSIAENEAEYIKIAVRLGLDCAWRQEISQRMSLRHEYLFEDPICVRGLEQFYEQVVQEKLAAPATGKLAFLQSGKKTVLHVGCGQYRKKALPEIFPTAETEENSAQNPPWQEIRLDIDPEVRPDIIGTITDLSAVPSESVDAVFSSHNLEHIYNYEVPRALAEFKRVLKPGGFATITLPDIQQVAKYVAEGKLEETLYVAPVGAIAAIDILYGLGSALANGNHYMAHKTGFTAETLAQKMEEAGFRNVEVRTGDNLDLWATGYK